MIDIKEMEQAINFLFENDMHEEGHKINDGLCKLTDSLQSAESELSTLRAELDKLKEQVHVWSDGAPQNSWYEESFIAILDTGARVVLKALPEEYAYDFTTADGTYYKSWRIKKWMQFPDSEFKSLVDPAPQQHKSCEICNDTKGGVTGNANKIDGKIVCDYCHADGSYLPAQQVQDETLEMVDAACKVFEDANLPVDQYYLGQACKKYLAAAKQSPAVAVKS